MEPKKTVFSVPLLEGEEATQETEDELSGGRGDDDEQ